MRNWIVIGLILLVVGLIGTFGTFGTKGDFSFGTEKVDRQQTISGDGVRNIEIDTGSVDVKVVPGAGDEVKASLTGRASKKYLDKLELKLAKEGDTLKVSFKDHLGFRIGFNILNVNLKLEVPQRQYASLKLDSGSGDNEVGGIQADAVVLDGGSGDMDLNGLRSKTITVSIGSGNLNASDVKADDGMKVKAGSGDVRIDGLTSKLIDVDLSSGNVNVADADAELKLETGSGDITVEQQTISRPAALRTGSGDVEYMTDEQPADAEISFSTGSGDLDNDWDGVKGMTDDDGVHHLVFGGGSVPVQVHTGSGDLDVGKR
ncbi:DUF4097 family beta strand repeat-containing protein [Paenibacillus glycinis]|uniref:DUF4097 family beta strand repeat protein n=1 Tax=Paenibacillus glycinis TaxID=2697035 RepID=A0ABW9XXR9_9BACL|nr:DUF4097 family beta strand repeat-containing protein [Paenibacillus glycinis]NBD27489.1 DUF4097 family beta strand repeat protein [Paenibacillus glycinis]